jgi:aliphatic nitrilase
MDLEATVDKTCALIAEAANNGAGLVAFPEAFIPAYPYWTWIKSAKDTSADFVAHHKAALPLPGPGLDKLCAAARENKIVAVIGCNEVDPRRTGTIYNANLIIDADGNLLGCHRKLVPTYAEKLAWGRGDGRDLRVFDTAAGRVGTLLCGENTNTLARFALLAQGEQIHVANFPAFPFSDWYAETEAIKIRCQAHAFEGKIFVISSTSLVSEACLDIICKDEPEKRSLFEGENYALTAVWGPDGQYLCEPLIDEEGIVYADIDLDDLIQPKMMHDIIGQYNDFDVLSLTLDQTPREPLEIVERAPGEASEGEILYDPDDEADFESELVIEVESED